MTLTVAETEVTQLEGVQVQVRVQFLGNDDFLGGPDGIGLVEEINLIRQRGLRSDEVLGAESRRADDVVGVT